MNYEQDLKEFKAITETMFNVFRAKRNDYGDTSAELLQRFGPNSLLVRIYDKFSRLANLLSGKSQRVIDESVYDTLIDLANYAIIAVIELQKQDEKKLNEKEYSLKNVGEMECQRY